MLIKGLWHLSIRARLTLLVMSLALPFAGYSILSSFEEARVEREHAGAQLFGIAQVTAARLDDQINDIRSVLQVLSAIVTSDLASHTSNDVVLAKLTGKVPAYTENLSVWTAAGENVGTLDARTTHLGTEPVTSQRFFQEALAGHGMSAQAPLESRATGQRISSFALPVFRGGQVAGVVAADVRLDTLQALLRSSADLPANAVVTILDQGGVVLARSLDPEHWIGKPIQNNVSGTASSGLVFGSDGPREGRSADGVERIAGFATVHSVNWRVYVGIPREQALTPVYARLRNNLLTASSILLVGLLLAGLVGESIASPLRALADDAGKFGSGNLGHRSNARGGCEVGLLARTLNTMAQQLESRARELLSTQAQLRQITDNMPALISYLDVNERFRFANQVYETWLGQRPSDLIGKSLVELYGVDAHTRFKDHIHEALSGVRVSYQRELLTIKGTRNVNVTAVPDFDDDGRVKGLFVMMIDVTATHQAEKALLDSERRLRMVADNIPALVTYVDREERYRFVNAYLGCVFHTDPQGLLGRTVRETGGERLYAQIAPHVAAALRGEEVIYHGEWTIKERVYHYQSTCVPDIDEQGTVQGYYAMTFDISALKETQHQLEILAHVDGLTGLPNRRQFEERLLGAMAHTRRGEASMAVMFLDIDHFKTINDTLGHVVGDLVLREFGTRLRHQVRTTDLVARLGGDEFVVLVDKLQDAEEVSVLAGKIVSSMRPEFMIEGQSMQITTSLGVAIFAGGDEGCAEVLGAADRALYAAKRKGRNRYSVADQTELLGAL